jgi:hypothetical protein
MVAFTIRVITKLPNSEQSYKGKVKTHKLKYINRQNLFFFDNFEGVMPFFTYNSLTKEEFFRDGETLVFLMMVILMI